VTSGVGAIGLHMVIRWLIKSVERSRSATQPEVVKVPIITPPPGPSPPPFSPPLVQWAEPRELVAWRAWRLGFFLRRAGGDGGPRLLSLSAPCIWNGPVVRDGAPLVDNRYPSGIYALKPEVADRIQWQNEHCWVTGTIALSGRVIEHQLGYRAERAVVRDLRLGVGAHLALRSLKQLREVIGGLESRYQVSVSVGQSEREIADRMLHSGHKPQCPKLPFVWDQHPWRLI
jgi:hypothetical protein